jgi:excisionase family DNA binding protein
MANVQRAEAPKLGLSITEWTAQTGIGKVLTYKLIKAGKIKTVKVGNKRIIPASEVERILTEGTEPSQLVPIPQIERARKRKAAA